MKRIHIIDATAYIFRAFHGIRELTSPSGFPTNAIYGYIQMLISILKEYRNEPVLAVFDSGKPSFRKEIYDLYKANRPEIDPNLKMQIPKCIEFTSLMGIPSFSMDGFEADDIIATYAKMAEKQGYSVVIHSSDKDLMQLINDSVILYDSMRSKTYNAQAVREKFGVGPELVGDLLSLMGDSSDNIPGVRGIGPKTAAKLLEEYGSLDKILENAANTGKSVATKLTEHLDDARLSRILVTLKEDVPVTYALEDIKHGDIDADVLKKELSELGFGNFLRQVLDFLGNRVVKKTVPSKTFEIVDINDENDAANMEFPNGMAIYAAWGKANPLTDDPAIIAVNGSKTWVFSVKEDLFGVGLFMDQIGSILRPFLENPAIGKTGCDIKFIISLFRRYSIQIKGALDDVFIAAYVLNPNDENYNIADLAARCDDVSPQTLENLQSTADFKTAASASAGVLKSICTKLGSEMESQGDSFKVY
ncbi:hypothetical protein KKD49_17895, partial [Myxococcota bacterium]|nr:hypothetical protein [Myxococcota bacterium]